MGNTERIKQYVEFQFTPLREGRRNVAQLVVRGKKYFNSRPSARGDRRRLS